MKRPGPDPPRRAWLARALGRGVLGAAAWPLLSRELQFLGPGYQPRY